MWSQVNLSGRFVEVSGAPARITELPFLRRRFSDQEAAAQAAARKGGLDSADATLSGCGLSALSIDRPKCLPSFWQGILHLGLTNS